MAIVTFKIQALKTDASVHAWMCVCMVSVYAHIYAWVCHMDMFLWVCVPGCVGSCTLVCTCTGVYRRFQATCLSSSRSTFFFETGSLTESGTHWFSETSWSASSGGASVSVHAALRLCTMIHSSFTWLLEINLACAANICQLAGIFLAVLYPREAFHQGPLLHHGLVDVLPVVQVNWGEGRSRVLFICLTLSLNYFSY